MTITRPSIRKRRLRRSRERAHQDISLPESAERTGEYNSGSSSDEHFSDVSLTKSCASFVRQISSASNLLDGGTAAEDMQDEEAKGLDARAARIRTALRRCEVHMLCK